MKNNVPNIAAGGESLLKQFSNILCFSPFRWKQSMPRPKQILKRLSGHFNVFFIEEPVYDPVEEAFITQRYINRQLCIITVHIPENMRKETTELTLKSVLDKYIKEKNLADSIFWYVNPMALSYTSHYRPAITIFDCINDFSRTRYSAKEFNRLKKQLYNRADIIFTSSNSLYQSKKEKHPNFHILPCCVNTNHFSHARGEVAEAAEQESIPYPRLGYIGSIDTHFDADLIKMIAEERPDWQIILVGHISDTEKATILEKQNIHFLGNRTYSELPSYLVGWNAALLPLKESRFVHSAAESFKVGEYLAAGVPVITTPLKEVKTVYENNHLVATAETAQEFINAAESIFFKNSADMEWLRHVDEFLSKNCLDNVIAGIREKIDETASHQTYINRVA